MGSIEGLDLTTLTITGLIAIVFCAIVAKIIVSSAKAPDDDHVSDQWMKEHSYDRKGDRL